MQRSDDLGKAFGHAVRARRVAAGLSQEQLAEAANLHRNYVGLVERGQNSPSLSAIAALAAALLLRPSDLLLQAEDTAGQA